MKCDRNYVHTSTYLQFVSCQVVWTLTHSMSSIGSYQKVMNWSLYGCYYQMNSYEGMTIKVVFGVSTVPLMLSNRSFLSHEFF